MRNRERMPFCMLWFITFFVAIYSYFEFMVEYNPQENPIMVFLILWGIIYGLIMIIAVPLAWWFE